jgi:catechol 2,3-dioxygenase-like lactoylglutathione lyase family enzyme
MIRGGLVIYFVRDVEVAVRFYVETLGMKLVEQAPHWYVVDAGDGFRIGLHAAKDASACEPKHPAGATSSFSSPVINLFPKLPIHQAVAILENRGVSLTTQDIDSGTIANFCDPDGNPLCLYQPK